MYFDRIYRRLYQNLSNILTGVEIPLYSNSSFIPVRNQKAINRALNVTLTYTR